MNSYTYVWDLLFASSNTTDIQNVSQYTVKGWTKHEVTFDCEDVHLD